MHTAGWPKCLLAHSALERTVLVSFGSGQLLALPCTMSGNLILLKQFQYDVRRIGNEVLGLEVVTDPGPWALGRRSSQGRFWISDILAHSAAGRTNTDRERGGKLSLQRGDAVFQGARVSTE